MKTKVDFSPDKRTWQPSPLAGQIVLVTTLNEDGTSNIAPKSWVSMMAFEPPILALGCNLKHSTAKNILRSGEFVVNMPGEELIDTIWASHKKPHPRSVESIGLSSIRATRLGPPRVEECKAHFECRLVKHISFGQEIMLIGQIEACSMDEALRESTDPYASLRIPFFLEKNCYGVIKKSCRLSTD